MRLFRGMNEVRDDKGSRNRALAAGGVAPRQQSKQELLERQEAMWENPVS